MSELTEAARETGTPQADADAAPIVLAREQPRPLCGLRLEPSLRRVVRDDGREEFVEPRVMQALVAFSRSQGAVVSRDQLLASCWNGVVVGEDSIDRVIARIRRLSGRLGGFRVETITRVGYRLIETPAQTVGGKQAKAPGARLSVCVLPFENMSDDPQQAYFSDGVTEDIITDLSKVSSLLVVARTTAFALRGQGLDVAQIASRLSVSHVLEGSVRKSQGRVRITAQLIDTVSGGHLWAERFDRAIDDIFAVQDEIAAAVVRALSVRLLPDEHHAIRQRETTNAHAHDLYLMARRYFVSGAQGDSRTLESIVRLCQRAIDLDPEYARAWAWMALAQSALKFVHDGAGDGGAAAVQQALKLNPELGDALAVKARLLSEQSREEEALACVERAVATDPESWAVNFNAGNIFYHWRRFDRAKVFWERAVASPDAGDNDAGMLLSTCAAIGDAEGMRRAAGIALERAERALARDDINGAAMCCGVTALAVLGEHARAREMAERGLLIDPDNVKMRYNFACGFVTHLDDHDTALELLGPAFQKMSPSWVKCACSDPDFDPILGDPRFQAMLAEAVARLGLDQQEIAALQVRSSR